MLAIKKYQFWFCTGSQDLYGDECLAHVAEHSQKIVSIRNVMAAVLAYFISGLGYFAAEYILFETVSIFWISMLQSLVQSGGSAVFFIVFGMALDKTAFKKRIMN